MPKKMFRHNPKAKYEPNCGRFLQKLTAKDFYQQQIVVSVKGSDFFDADDYFTANFPNIFTNYMLGGMRVESPLFQHWESQPMKLWQTQLNFAVFCASSACGVSSAHLNYKKHSLVRAAYRFHVYYHIRRILKRLQVVLPHEANFNISDNPYTESEFYNLCHEYNVPNDPMRYRFEKFFGSYQTGGWDDYINPNSMTRWIIQTSNGFTDIGLVKISESIRAYAYLILTSQASARANIIGTMGNALTTQQIYLNNFENIVNRRVDLQEDIKRYQDTLNYASSKVDYSVGEGLYMLPSDMNLRIKRGVAGYNNKIMISHGFHLATNEGVNKPTSEEKHKPTGTGGASSEGSESHVANPQKKSSHHYSQSTLKKLKRDKLKDKNQKVRSPTDKGVAQHSKQSHAEPKGEPKGEPNSITPEEEKIALVITIFCAFTAWHYLRK